MGTSWMEVERDGLGQMGGETGWEPYRAEWRWDGTAQLR